MLFVFRGCNNHHFVLCFKALPILQTPQLPVPPHNQGYHRTWWQGKLLDDAAHRVLPLLKAIIWTNEWEGSSSSIWKVSG